MPGGDTAEALEPEPSPDGPVRFRVDPDRRLDAHRPHARRRKRLPADRLVAWALRYWGPRMALGTSFQAEGMVLLDMAHRLSRSRSGSRGPEPDLRVFTIDTGRLPPETHELIDRVRGRYGVEVEVYLPAADRVERLVRLGGPNLFYRSVEDRLACCEARKVEPLRRALAGLDAWMTGLRREQSPTRTGVQPVTVDPEHGGIAKLAPLADWTRDEVWSYIRSRDVPYHPLYDRGYTSIGCAPCTRPTRPDEDPRAGRWWWEEGQAKECGLHGVGSHPPAHGDSEGVGFGAEARAESGLGA